MSHRSDITAWILFVEVQLYFSQPQFPHLLCEAVALKGFELKNPPLQMALLLSDVTFETCFHLALWRCRHCGTCLKSLVISLGSLHLECLWKTGKETKQEVDQSI